MITDMNREELQLVIDATEWRKTNYIQPHEYVMQHTHPVLFAALAKVLESDEDVYSGTFRGWAYRYLNIGDYKYWRIEDVLNRELLPQHSSSPRQENIRSNPN